MTATEHQPAKTEAREPRARKRRRLAIGAVALAGLVAVVVAGLAVAHAMRGPATPPFQPANTEQQIGYQIAYRDTVDDLQQGETVSYINGRCRMTAAMSSTPDLAIGTLAGCADALQANGD